MADTAYLSVSQLKTADQLAAKRADLEQLRGPDKRDWALNRAFYNGNQWVFWNRVLSQVEQLPVEDGDKPRWKVRLTNNSIRPGVRHYVSQLTKSRPIIRASPDSGAHRDVMAADMATSLFDWWWHELNMRSKIQDALVNSAISQGWWKITWDELAGKSMQIRLGPDGKPITDEELGDIFFEELEDQAEQQGFDPQQLLQKYQKTVYVGDIRIEPLAGDQVLLDPAPADYRDATYAVCKHSLDVDEIQARWGVKVEPNSSSYNDLPLAFSRKPDSKPKTLRDVYIGYFKPTPTLKKGRYVVWIEEPNQILEDKAWPYPFNDLPLIKFPGQYKPGSSTDEPIISDARPLQKELNRTLSQIVQFKDLTIKPQMIAPIGSLRQRLTDEPGAVFEYQPIQGLMPEWRQMPQLPTSSVQILADIQNRINIIFNKIPSERDQLPARLDSGDSIEAVQEAIADQMSPTVTRIEEALAQAGRLLVLLAQEYYTETRFLKIKGMNGSTQVKKFMGADLKGGFSFQPETGTGLPYSREGKRQLVMDLVDKQLIDNKKALRLLDLGDMNSLKEQFAADEDMAYREHEKLIKGTATNTLGAQQAMEQGQQMMQDPMADPDGDGKPDPPELKQEIIQQMVTQAAFQPTEWEDWETHLEVHGQYMKSFEFEHLPSDAQERFLNHFSATLERVIAVRRAQLSFDPKNQPRVNLNMRATSSAATAAALLNNQGIQVSEEQVAEPPLDTAVFDSLDKPVVDASGNTPADSMALIQKLQQESDQHNLVQAKTAHQMALAQQQQDQASATDQHQQAQKGLADANEQDAAAAQHDQKGIHTEQMHAQRMRQQEEMHRQRMRAAMQAAKSKPAKGGK